MFFRKLLAMLLLCSSTAFADSKVEEIAIWPDLAPGTEETENKEYKDEKGSIYAVYQPSLSVYQAHSAKGPTPAVIVTPGGGYRKIDYRKEGHKIARWLNKNGITAFVLKYRLNPKDALRDAQRAVSFLRHNADDYNIATNKIGILGFSAGGHVSANLVMNHGQREAYDIIDEQSSRPDFWVGIYGAYQQIYGEGGSVETRSNVSPGFFVHAADDSKVSVSESVRIFTEMKQVGAPAELHIFEQGEHGFALEKDRGEAVTSTVKSWSKRCVQWLQLKNII